MRIRPTAQATKTTNASEPASKFSLRKLRGSLFRTSSLSLVGVPIALMANIILARSLSVRDMGTFGFAISISTVLSIPATSGVPMMLTREVAKYSQHNNWGAYRGIVIAAHGWVIAMCAVMAPVLIGWAWNSSDLGTGPLLVTFLLIPLMAFNGIRSGILNGLGHPVLALAPIQILHPSLLLIGYLGLFWLGRSVAMNALMWYWCAVAVTLGVGSLLLLRVRPPASQGVKADLTELPRWGRSALPFFMISAAITVTPQIAVLLLGFTGQEEAVAELRVAERGSQIIWLPVVAANAILPPYFVHALKSELDGALRRVAQQSARLLLITTLPAALLMLLFGDTLIGWTFGAPYDAVSYWPLVILITAMIASVSLGESGLLLLIGGHEKQTLAGLIVSLIVSVALGLLLIAPYGAVGAAFSAGTGMLSNKAYCYLAVWRHYGFSSAVI
ncbi:oligosaccharide flippase family protein [Planctomycetota bacterium]|nr:oligosaccharide flippase family protein [Planctomycetota bacterium]